MSLIMGSHVFFPCHFKLFLILWVSALNYEFITEDVCELSTISITSTNDSFFIIVVVATSQQVSEDQLRNIYFVLSVNYYRDSFSIIMYSNRSFFLIYLNLELIHFFISLIVIRSIYKHFIKYLVETRCIQNLFRLES